MAILAEVVQVGGMVVDLSPGPFHMGLGPGWIVYLRSNESMS